MPQTWLRRSIRCLLGVVLPLGLLAIAWRRVDVPAGLERLADAGPLATLALLPLAAMLALDALGWRLLFAPSTRRDIPLGRALAARLAGEAVASLPSAGLAGEAASAWYLWRRVHVPLEQSIGTLAARRALLAAGHAAILALAALAAAALGLLVAAVLASRVLVHGSPFARLRSALRRAPWAGLRSWAGAAGLRVADRAAARPFVESRLSRLRPLLCYALMFLAESVETLLLLRLVGAEASVAQVMAIEPLVALLRALAFFAPAGLGVQELGYVTLLHQVGVPEAAAVGAAFVLLKRTREVVSTALGWTVLLTADTQASPEMEEASEPAKTACAVHLRVAQPDDADAPDRARVA